MKLISYRKLRKYKYQIIEDYRIDIPLKSKDNIDTPFIKLDNSGELIIKEKYAWDGPSGPTIDTKNFMRGSLIHDALYQLMREKQIDIDQRNAADKLLQQHCREDGMSVIRAWIVYLGVKWFGKKSALPQEEEQEIYQAP